MEIFLLNLCLVFFVIYFAKKNRHGLHILQLESYYNDRYFGWIKKNICSVLNIKHIALLILPIVILLIDYDKLKILALVLEIMALFVLILVTRIKKEKKPFVVTARVKRMYVTYLILIVLLAAAVNMLDLRCAMALMGLAGILSYFFVIIVNVINKPVEGSIRKGFCIKAKKKLKGVPGLEVLGITGSYGKTSTKYAVSTILSQKYNTLMTPESFNTTMGVVRTINEKLSPMHHLFVCEMGAKYIGDIKEITDIVEPKYGILTAIGPQHLDTFKSIENVSKAKMELVDSLPKDVGIAFVNWEDENIRKVKFDKTIVKYGLSKEADYYAENIETGERGSTFDVVIPGKESIKIKTRLLGKLNILNVVCAVAVADKLGLSPEEIKVGAKYLRPVPHRLELRQNPNGSIIIDDAYNSNIRGASMALEVLKSFENKKRILITPGIVDLGDKAKEINKELGNKAAEASDFIILVGAKQAIPIFEGIREKKYPEKNVYIANNLEDALRKMNQIIDSNSVVLLENDLPDNYL